MSQSRKKDQLIPLFPYPCQKNLAPSLRAQQNNYYLNWKNLLGFINLQEKLENRIVVSPTLADAKDICHNFFQFISFFFLRIKINKYRNAFLILIQKLFVLTKEYKIARVEKRPPISLPLPKRIAPSIKALPDITSNPD